MRYVIEIEQVITLPMVVNAGSEHEAREMAKQVLQGTAITDPEAVGDPVVEVPCIRSVRELGA